MKVLFAVNNEKISESIIKRYQRDYKEIISSKNVYYFNAILKELQKDKSYDRIIISEDLEPFSNNNYEAIEKFIFDKLDQISDEAFNQEGSNIPIILISSDRHTRPEPILVKLFGIGIYDVLVGQDRSVEKVCELLNKPRSKKQAKLYYKIDSDDVKYKPEKENDVSEVEIQNILKHYKKLGKNEEKYVESFNSIAVQYTDEQLKLIINFLPKNVISVLEEMSPKYRQVMGLNPKNIRSGKYASKRDQNKKIEFIEKELNKQKLSKPVIIPTTVDTNKVKKIVEKKDNDRIENLNKKKLVSVSNKSKIEATKKVSIPEEEKIEEPIKRKRGRPPKNKSAEEIVGKEIQAEEPVKRKRGRPPKNKKVQDNEVEQIANNISKNVKTKKSIVAKDDNEDDDILTLNGFEENDSDLLAGFNDIDDNNDLLDFDDYEDNNNFEEENYEEDDYYQDDKDNYEEDDDNLIEFEDYNEDDESLPGFDDIEDDDNDDFIDSSDNIDYYDSDDIDEENYNDESYEDEYYEDDESLPGFDDIEEDDESLSDSDDIEEDDESLPGFDDIEDESLLDFEDEDMDDEDDEDISLNSYNEEISNPNFKRLEPIEKSKEIENTNKYNSSVNFNIDNLISSDQKLVAFVGTSKNGTSFLVNNLAQMFSERGVNTAVLDLTQNRNAYYIYTDNREELRNVAYNCIENLRKGISQGITVNNNLTVYTSLPDEIEGLKDYENIIQTLLNNYSLVLLDCDFETQYEYFNIAQELYLVQSLDILTIQPLTAFLRELKAKNILDQNKLKIVINKHIRLSNMTDRLLIGGMSSYNDPSMSYMTNLFDKSNVKSVTIPFDIQAYTKYLDGLVDCKISLRGYSKNMIQKLNELGDMVFPLINNNKPVKNKKYNNYTSNFSFNTNNTLNKMRRKY